MKNSTRLATVLLLVLAGCHAGQPAADSGQAGSAAWKRVDYKDVGISLELPRGETGYARVFVMEDNKNATMLGKLIGMKDNSGVRMDEPIYLMNIYVFRGKAGGHETDKKLNKFEFSYGTLKYNEAFSAVQETSATLTGDEAFPFKTKTVHISMRGHNTPNGDVILAFGILDVGAKTAATEEQDRETIRHILNSAKGSEE